MRNNTAFRRILIVNETPVPKDERTWLEARTLAEAGHAVSVVCPAADGEGTCSKTLDGIDMHYYSAPRQAEGVLGYVWEFAYCWLRSLAAALGLMRRAGLDVVHACNPPDTFWLLGALLRPFGVRYVFAQHDLCPELWLSRFPDEARRGRLIHRCLLLLERMSYRIADVVITPNESYRAVAATRGSRSLDSVFVVRNGPDLAKVKLVEPRPQLKRGRDYLIGYLGIMNPQDGVDYLLRAHAHLVHERKRTDVQLALIGSGDVLEQLKALARELRVEDSVTFAGWISDPDLLSAYLCTSDVCVAPDPKTPLNEVSSFMKIMDYMAAAKPVVAFDLAETRVSAGDAALYAIPDDIVDLADKIEELLDDEKRRDRMGVLGRARIEDALSWDHAKQHLLAAYGSLAVKASAVCLRSERSLS